MDLLELLAAERCTLADVLDGLSTEQWERPTLAAGWTARHVVAHLVMPFRYSIPRFAFNMVRARGNFDRMADRVARRDGALPADELVSILRANASNRWTPPGAGYEAPLTDLAMHTLDICRPLGIVPTRPPEVSVAVLDNLASGQSQRYFKLDLSGVVMQATDVPWRHGGAQGQLVTGPSDDLILALGTRPAGLDGVCGPGVAAFRGRAAVTR